MAGKLKKCIDNGEHNLFTEDDTFHKLKKIPFNDMQMKTNERLLETLKATGIVCNSLGDDFFRKFGWTEKEYYIELYNRYNTNHD